MHFSVYRIGSLQFRSLYLIVIALCIIVLCEFVQCTSNSVSKDSRKKSSSQSSEKIRFVYGINAGGGEHTDVHGIKYQADPLKVGVASDYGKRLMTIGRTHLDDEILYRTERYSESTFGYTLPIPEDGSYVLVLKFCEVYFQHAGEKVFDVKLNSKHVIVSDLDIFAAAGYGYAHQEVIPFTVSGGRKKLTLDEDERTSEIRNDGIRLDFVKIPGHFDNPKINAFYLMKGGLEDVPLLPDLPQHHEEIFEDEDEFEGYDEMHAFPDEDGPSEDAFQRLPSSQRRLKREVPAQDPWEEVSVLATLFPILATLATGAAAIWLIFRKLKNL